MFSFKYFFPSNNMTFGCNNTQVIPFLNIRDSKIKTWLACSRETGRWLHGDRQQRINRNLDAQYFPSDNNKAYHVWLIPLYFYYFILLISFIWHIDLYFLVHVKVIKYSVCLRLTGWWRMNWWHVSTSRVENKSFCFKHHLCSWQFLISMIL